MQSVTAFYEESIYIGNKIGSIGGNDTQPAKENNNVGLTDAPNFGAAHTGIPFSSATLK